MTEIRFYHLQQKKLEQALPEILAKALDREYRVVIKTADAGGRDNLNTALWTYDPDSFLPHGTAKEGSAAEQPIWITTEDENPNGANMLVLAQGAVSNDIGNFALCCEVFDGNDETAVLAARARWKVYKDGGHTLTYFQQDDAGKWQKK